MRNLKHYEVKELDKIELKKVYGGWVRIVLGALAAIAKEVIGDWDNFKAGMNGDAPINE